MGLLSFLGIIEKAQDLASEYIEDKDKANELRAHLAEIKEQVYVTELNTKTVPWVDALHKMGRQILSVLNLVVPSVLLYVQPEIDPLSLAAIVGPSGVYNYVKGRGK